MCGIAGIFRKNNQDKNDLEPKLNAMLKAMTHRGPDASGMFVRETMALGVNRLAIMDPKPRSDQPITSSCGRFTIAFNGEIYNFRALRDQLIQQGETFATQSDTEVLLSLYEHNGAKCLSRLRGMFAFAIWDQQSRKLFVARDRMGEKPFYYFENSDVFMFASEIPGLLSSSEVPRRMDPSGINQALSFMHPIAPRTAFKDIKKLPPAHYMEISYDRTKITRYWALTFDPSDKFTDETQCIEEIQSCLDQTVSLMCGADTALGALLSGGIDSSAIVASMGSALKNFPTFRISASVQTPDSIQEALSARQVADRYQAQHYEFIIHSDSFSLMKEVVRHHGEPIATPVPMDAYLVSQEIGKQVKVALCGAGGDELFGGYLDHALMSLWGHYIEQWTIPDGTLSFPKEVTTDEEKLALQILRQLAPDHPERIFSTFRYNNFDIQNKIYSDRMLEFSREASPWRFVQTYIWTAVPTIYLTGYLPST